jgi:hypothetical protein
MGSRKNDTEGIDEALLLASITQRKRDGSIQPTNEVQPPVQSLNEETVSTDKVQEPQKEATRKKKQSAGYDSVFLQRNEIKTRQCVYISREVHTKKSKILNV